MVILHIQRMEKVSGSEKYIQDLALIQLARQHAVHVIISCRESDRHKLIAYQEDLSQRGVVVHILVSSAVFAPSMLRQMSILTGKIKPDIIHTHLLHADVYGVILSKVFRQKFRHISTKHGYAEGYVASYGYDVPAIPWGDPFYLLSKLTEPFIDQSYAASQGLARFYKELRVTRQEMPFIHHGLSTEQLQLADECLAAAEPANRPTIVTVGRLVPLKRVSMLIGAVAMVKEVHPGILLQIIGDGPERKALEEQVKKSGLSHNVSFLGHQQPYPFYAAADFVVIPSRAEAFGLVFIEAFAHNKPVISYDVPAANEIIEDEVTGYLVGTPTTSALAEKIIHLLANTGLQQQMGINARARILSHYNYERVYKQVIEVYNG